MIYQIKVQIKGVTDPTVWRRILIPSDASFANLHEVIQKAFGWHDRFFYQFSKTKDDQRWTVTEEGKDEYGLGRWFETIKAKDIAIGEILNEDCKRIVYTYDLRDPDWQRWQHAIILEKSDYQKCKDTEHAHCIKGNGCCPPDIIGGEWYYSMLKEFIRKYPEWAMRLINGTDTEEDEERSYNVYCDNKIYQTIPYVGMFFQLTDGKPDFAKIDLDQLEAEVSKIKLDKITKKARKDRSKEPLTMEEISQSPILRDLFFALLKRQMLDDKFPYL